MQTLVLYLFFIFCVCAQRAMSLYRKQKEGMKEVMHHALLLVRSEQNNRSESTDGEVTAKSTNHMEEELLPAKAATDGDYMEEDRDSADNYVEGEHRPPGDSKEKEGSNKRIHVGQQVDNCSIDAEGKGCDKISDAVISVEGPEGSEAIIPECRVNLSRIHLSSESTH